MPATPPLYRTTHRTPVGELTLIASDRGLRAILWPKERPVRAGIASRLRSAPEHPILRRTAVQLDEYFAGTRTSFDVPLDLVGTRFQLAAWRALGDIPFGETTSYGRQARAIGVPSAARALGAANRANPVCIVLPCHRVIGANGSLTGFAGGLATKQWLLDHEARIAQEQSASGDSLSAARKSRQAAVRSIGTWPSGHPAQRRLSLPVG